MIHTAGLKKVLGLWDSVAVITSIVIGVGIFRVPSEVARYLDSPALILAAWLIGGVIVFLGGSCYAELVSSFPKTGGNYIYLKEGYGRWAGFLFGWAELTAIRTGSIAAVAFIAAEHICSLFAFDGFLIKPAAIAIITALSLINMFGLRHGKKVHNLFTAVSISALLAMALFALFSGKGDLSHFKTVEPMNLNIFPKLALAMIPILWTYGGWHENTFLAGETKDASRTVPAALITAILLVTLLYFATNFTYLYLIPLIEMPESILIGAETSYILFGRYGRKIFESIVVMASLGSINAMIIIASRVTYAMAEDNTLFRRIGRIHPKYGVPRGSIILNGVWAIALVALGSFSNLLFFTGVLVWLFFAAVIFAIFILRRKYSRIETRYKVWGYPFTPAVFFLICLSLFINALIFNPLPSVLGIAILSLGIPVYMVSIWMGKTASVGDLGT